MASMGPRARARGNPNHSGAGHSRDVLQWGHERALVEIGRSPFRGGRRTALQWGHERALVEIRPIRPPRAAILGFNGATSARSWKWSEVGACGLLWFGLQWGHERALVEIISTRRDRAAGRSFNGATSARSWKYLRRIPGVAQRARFNGATSARSWKYTTRTAGRACSASFNGATSARSWKSAGVLAPLPIALARSEEHTS